MSLAQQGIGIVIAFIGLIFGWGALGNKNWIMVGVYLGVIVIGAGTFLKGRDDY